MAHDLIESASSCSSDSDDDSLYGSSTLNASQWNRQRALRPIRPLSTPSSADEDGDEHDHGFAHFVTKRRYVVTPYIPSSQDESNDGGDENKGKGTENDKSEIEKAVLMDCLANHFLWSHLPQAELEVLCGAFKKYSYRDHEIVYSRGDAAKYMYIVYSGEVDRPSTASSANEEGGGRYTILGELSLLTGTPYTETVHAASRTCTLFRLDNISFHRALRPSPEIDIDERISLFKSTIPDELVDYFTTSDLKQVALAMTTHLFDAGDVLVRKKDQLDSLVIIAKGSVIAKDVSLGGRTYDDQIYGTNAPSLSFGWQSLLASTDRPPPNFRGRMVAQTDGTALTLSKSSFGNIMKSHHHDDSSSMLEQMAAYRLARIELQKMQCFQDSSLNETEINNLLELMHRCVYTPEPTSENGTELIFKAGDKIEAALYFVREGSVTLEKNKGEDISQVAAGDYFGEADILRDQNKDGKKHFVFRSPMTALAHGPRTVLDILYLEECRSVINTTMLGLGESTHTSEYADASIQWADIQRHSLLGTGTFGQVFLASIPENRKARRSKKEKQNEHKSGGDEVHRQTVALKVQSKHQVIENGEAGRAMAERNILASLHRSPFLLQLIHAFQDESLLYMITSVAQGGELESLIPDEGMCEQSAKFYAAGILEGLSFMHRRHLIHRDLKPANVLINEKGYPVLIDFGFAKYVPDKTFTFVGSPFFTAPEIIRYQGHDKACDYWSWAVLVYRLVTGRYPFYQKGIDELELYKRICRGTIEIDGQMSTEFRLLITSVLYPNPAKRLGSGRSGWRDIFNTPWFAAKNVSLDLKKLRMQQMPAPWVPDLSDPLDASSFHPRNESEIDDLLRQTFPAIEEKHEQLFATFGPQLMD